MCCSKIILFVSNALLFVFGVIVIIFSSIVISRGSDYGTLLMDGVLALPIVILLFGLFVCILGFLGCFGALRESKCMLYTYSGIVLLLFFGEIVVAILILAHPNFTRDVLEKTLTTQFDLYNDPGQDATTKAIDNMQTNLQCCGVNGPSYWLLSGIPPSCCPAPLNRATCTLVNAYSQGCVDAVIEEFKSVIIILGVCGLVLGLFMVFSIFTACGLARRENYS